MAISLIPAGDFIAPFTILNLHPMERGLLHRLVEKVGDVHDLDLGAGLAQSSLDLKQTAGIRADDDLRPSFEDVFDLSGLQAFGHFRLGQIVSTRAAAADI